MDIKKQHTVWVLANRKAIQLHSEYQVDIKQPNHRGNPGLTIHRGFKPLRSHCGVHPSMLHIT